MGQLFLRDILVARASGPINAQQLQVIKWFERRILFLTGPRIKAREYMIHISSQNGLVQYCKLRGKHISRKSEDRSLQAWHFDNDLMMKQTIGECERRQDATLGMMNGSTDWWSPWSKHSWVGNARGGRIINLYLLFTNIFRLFYYFSSFPQLLEQREFARLGFQSLIIPFHRSLKAPFSQIQVQVNHWFVTEIYRHHNLGRDNGLLATNWSCPHQPLWLDLLYIDRELVMYSAVLLHDRVTLVGFFC